MLTDDQCNVLVLLKGLSQAALSAADQTSHVTQINEAILKLEDEAEEARLLGLPDNGNGSFVKIARVRLVEAQGAAAENCERRRRAKVARIVDSTSETDLNADPVQRSLSESSDEEIASSVRETKSENITQVLQRMHDLAQAEVLKGELNISELEMSSKTLRELQDKYSGVDVLLNGSKRLVKILDEADKADRRMMQASLGFLAAVLVYIIYRRILAGPLKILLWSLFQFVGVIKWAAPKSGAVSPSAVVPSAVVPSVASSLTAEVSLATPPVVLEVYDSAHSFEVVEEQHNESIDHAEL